MGVYVKAKISSTTKEYVDDNSFSSNAKRVGIKEGAESIIIDYLTNLYSNPSTAVIRELFTNACDAITSTNGNIVIAFSFNGSDYDLAITDYGCGMSSDELYENYATYANSSKIDNFDSIGSFGLGSKSPLALVPSYEVYSSDGKEHTKIYVGRTKNKGIMSDKEELPKIDFTYTKVRISGLSCIIIRSMINFAENLIIPFSKVNVDLQYDEKCLDIRDSSINKRDFSYSYDITINSPYPITLMTNIPETALYKFGEAKSAFSVYARINNIVYPIYGSSLLSSSEKDSVGVIVVDIEPGYFEFAPNRESLPNGKELNHLIEIINKNATFGSRDEFIKFILDRKYIDSQYVFDFEKKNLFSKIKDSDCFASLPDDYRKEIDIIKKVVNGNFDDIECDDSITAISYENKNALIGRSKKAIQRNISVFEALKNSIAIGSRKSSYYHLNINVIKVVTGLKKTRKGNLIIPTEYRISNMSKQLADVKNHFNISEGCNSYMNYEFAQYVLVLIPDGVKISDDLKILFKYASAFSTDKKTKIEPAKFEKYVPNEKQESKRAAIRQGADRYFVIRSTIALGTQRINSEKLQNIIKADKCLLYYGTQLSKDVAHALAVVNDKVFVSVSDTSKILKNHLEELGYKFVTVSKNKDSVLNVNSFTGQLISFNELKNNFTLSEEADNSFAKLFNLNVNNPITWNNKIIDFNYSSVSIDWNELDFDEKVKLSYHEEHSFKSFIDNNSRFIVDYTKYTDNPSKESSIAYNLPKSGYYSCIRRAVKKFSTNIMENNACKIIDPKLVVDSEYEYMLYSNIEKEILNVRSATFFSDRVKNIAESIVPKHEKTAVDDSIIRNIDVVNEYKLRRDSDSIAQECFAALKVFNKSSTNKKYCVIARNLDKNDNIDALIIDKINEDFNELRENLQKAFEC